jgi:hypothetical protein
MSPCMLLVILVRFQLNLNFLNVFSLKQNIKCHQNLPSGSRVVQCGRTDGHYEANGPFSHFANAPKKINMQIVRNVHFHMKIIRTFSKTLSLHSSLIMSDQVSHPYKTTDKIIVLVSTLHFSIANWKIKDSAPNDRKGLNSASWVKKYGQ